MIALSIFRVGSGASGGSPFRKLPWEAARTGPLHCAAPRRPPSMAAPAGCGPMGAIMVSRVRIEDVAEAARVSMKTVPRVLHREPNVRKETHERVLETVQ